MGNKSHILKFKHSGKLGDIIYSLPTIIALGGGILYVGRKRSPMNIIKGVSKPRPMAAKMVNQMIDLLIRQSYLSDVLPYNNESVDYDLDKYREQNVSRDHLALCHLKAFGVEYDLSKPWLENIKPIYINEIVIQNSFEHRDASLDWQFLKGYENKCVFVGFKKEYKKFKKEIGLNINYYPIKSILELAGVIKGSKLFIGNQSLGFALAEGMKHPRVLEVCHLEPNCMPQSNNGHTILTKDLLKNLIN